MNTTNYPLLKATKLSAGHDLYSLVDCIIPARGRATIDTGIIIHIQPGYWCKIEGRSSLALKGIVPGAGVIDADYPDSIKVLLFNHTDEDYHIYEGDRIAQLILQNHSSFDNAIIGGDRTGGFGSTGN